MLDVLPSSRAGSLPHWICGEYKNGELRSSTVGASLLAIAVGQPTLMSPETALSRASFAPTRVTLSGAGNIFFHIALRDFGCSFVL
jgi:hypothetical protein